MIVELLALLTAFLWATGSIWLKKGLKSSNATSATLIRTTMGFAIFWVLAILFVPLDSFRYEAVIYHVIAGVLAGFIGMQLSYISMKDMEYRNLQQSCLHRVCSLLLRQFSFWARY